ncbi:MAG: hypothetical protein IH811_00550 [Proteobacteria bacterium]|nr:hypothetical protein [Pseudomonadota bacterium]
MKIMGIEIYSLYLNKFRKNLAAPGKLLLHCSTTYVPVGDLDRSPLIKEPLSKSYASAGDRSTLFAIFSLSFGPFMQYAG